MKTEIPLKKLDDSALGIKIEKMSDAYVESIQHDVARSHRNDFCICILPFKGKADFFVDFKEIHLSPGSLLFLYPGQVQRVIRTQNIEGWILYFDNKMLEDYPRSVLEESLYHGPLLLLSKEQKVWLLQIMEIFYNTAALRDMAAFHKTAMRNVLGLFICRLTSIYQITVTQNMNLHSQRSNTIVAAFRKLLRSHYKEIKSPQEYAVLMNISLGYLNDTVKMVTGKTISQSIQEETIREAQRLLWYSDMNIKQISGSVGFDDPKYFSRVFSKITGRSPADFRRNYKENE